MNTPPAGGVRAVVLVVLIASTVPAGVATPTPTADMSPGADEGIEAMATAADRTGRP